MTSTQDKPAADGLEELEQKVLAGADVSVDDVAKAQAAGLLGAWHEQKAARDAEDAARADAAARRDEAKAQARALVADFVSPIEAYDQAVAALGELVAAIRDNNAMLAKGRDVLQRGGVPPLWIHAAEAPDNHDDQNFVRLAPGNDVTELVLDGQSYAAQQAHEWVVAALSTAVPGLRARGHDVTVAPDQFPPALKGRDL